jgi:hypothetical protein
MVTISPVAALVVALVVLVVVVAIVAVLTLGSKRRSHDQ